MMPKCKQKIHKNDQYSMDFGFLKNQKKGFTPSSNA
jgi:hypothetical protein